LIHQGGQIDLITADKAYDQSRVYEATLRERNQDIKSIDKDGILGCRRTVKLNMFFRFKKLVIDELKARNENFRRGQSVIACNILNRFRVVGSP
jgi:hypothetical protein